MTTDEYLKQSGKSPMDHVTFADLEAMKQDAPAVDPEVAQKAARRAELQAQLDSLK